MCIDVSFVLDDPGNFGLCRLVVAFDNLVGFGLTQVVRIKLEVIKHRLLVLGPGDLCHDVAGRNLDTVANRWRLAKRWDVNQCLGQIDTRLPQCVRQVLGVNVNATALGDMICERLHGRWRYVLNLGVRCQLA